MRPKKVTTKELDDILEGVKDQSIDAIGNYLFKDYRIQISKYKLTGAQRVQLLYQKRRSRGQCIVCAKKVTKRNPSTGKLYRLCEFHRTKIDKKKG